MEIAFNAQELERVNKIKDHYPTEQAALMPVLWLAQRTFGWISPDVMQYVADLLHLPFAQVEGVATFYTMYFKKPMGKYHVQVCTNVSCMLMDGDSIYHHVSKKYGLKNMETTSDGKFSLEEVECMGACGGAPVVVINEDYYELSSIESIDKLLESLN
ncbi:MAG: NADH-quinone oxidoreductase subunit NuoE [Candidatus Kapabacteria bacterium]|nr:NADH-quinone oxidoreductase subunit NuoE [Candidatus Kapabacteria bacterium]